MASRKTKWIQSAIKKPGALRAQASKEGALKDGISPEWLEEAAGKKGKVGQRARLAKTLKGMRRKKVSKMIRGK